MGSSKRPKPRGQPVTALAPGGGVSGGVQLDTRVVPSVLKVPLVTIDRSVAAGCRVGHSVTVRRRDATYSVFVEAGRVGDVPVRFRAHLAKGYRTGEVAELSTTPLRVVVSLQR
jgi:hypothetical protein